MIPSSTTTKQGQRSCRPFQAMPGAGPDPFSRPAAIINSLRSAVDSGAIKFYSTDKAHPDEQQLVNLSCGPYVSEPVSLPDFLLNKVWSLGFKAGRKDTSVWIPDPWDATYLGSSTSELQQSAAVLDAQEKIVLDDSHEFASVGRTLLAQEGPKQLATVAAPPKFRTALGAYTLGSPLGEGGSGKVFRVVDEDGSEHALKYLKPEGQSSQKSRRFKNELAFCLKNTNPNIITVEDWGLAQVNDVEVPFYVMPVYPQTLRTLMDQETSPDLLMVIFLQILDGVGAAHAKGIWHRDLKPQNVSTTRPQIELWSRISGSPILQRAFCTRPSKRAPAIGWRIFATRHPNNGRTESLINEPTYTL